MVVSNGCNPDPRVEKEAASLSASGYQVRVLAWDRSTRLPKQRTKDGFTIDCFARASRAGSGLRQLSSFLGFWRWAAASIVQLRPRVVHCHDLDTYVPAFVAARRLGVPLVFDAHEVYAEMQRERLPAPLVGMLRRFDRWGARHAQAFITVGEAPRQYYAAVRPDAAVVANWNVPVADDEDARRRVREQLQIPPDAFVVGHLGGLDWVRDLTPLVGALDLDRRFYALIAGAGAQADELRARAASEPRLKFIGYTPDPAPYYHAIDCLYYAFRDGFAYSQFSNANALGFSFAYARPLITAATGDTGRIAKSVASELILDCQTPEALVRVLDRVRVPGTYQEIRQRLRAAADTRYSWSAAAQELEAVYSRLLNGNHSAQ